MKKMPRCDIYYESIIGIYETENKNKSTVVRGNKCKQFNEVRHNILRLLALSRSISITPKWNSSFRDKNERWDYYLGIVAPVSAS